MIHKFKEIQKDIWPGLLDKAVIEEIMTKSEQKRCIKSNGLSDELIQLIEERVEKSTVPFSAFTLTFLKRQIEY
mgnify:CR=1 FL=1